MTPKTWATVASGGINTVNPNFSGVPSDQSHVIDKWDGGAAYGSKYWLTGGGHADYAGNDTYALELNATSPAWTRPVGPTVDTSGGDQASNGAANYADLAPRATHSQQRLVATPGKFWIAGMDNFSSSGGLDSSAVFYYDSSWHALGAQLTTGEFNAASFGWHGGVSVYDPTSDYIWMFAQQTGLDTDTCAVLINATSQATRKVKGYLPFSYCTGVCANDLRVILIAEGGGGLFAFDVSSLPANGATITRVSCPISGTSTPSWLPNVSADHGGMVYHKASRAMLAWNNNGANVVKIAIPANPLDGVSNYTVTTITPDASNAVTPSAQSATGTFGRFNVVTVGGIDCLVLTNAYTESTYVYRLPAAGV